ncbi:hypothetical protein [Roseofilum sp. Belize Diploria]|nr:hypothetical protein [Roseofilum sp. Belize Diploria]
MLYYEDKLDTTSFALDLETYLYGIGIGDYLRVAILFHQNIVQMY